MITDLIGLLIGILIAFYLVGLGVSLAIGQMPMGKKFTRIYLGGVWKVIRWTLKGLIALATSVMKLIDSKL